MSLKKHLLNQRKAKSATPILQSIPPFRMRLLNWGFVCTEIPTILWILYLDSADTQTHTLACLSQKNANTHTCKQVYRTY